MEKWPWYWDLVVAWLLFGLPYAAALFVPSPHPSMLSIHPAAGEQGGVFLGGCF
jgi:hypothetical protein